MAAPRRRAAPRPRRARGARGPLTYARAARARARLDVAPGSRVASRSTARPAWTSRSPCTPACWPARRDAGRPAARRARARSALASADRRPATSAHRRRAPPMPPDDDVASWSTPPAPPRRPRPVELSFGNIQANALGSAVALGLDPDERWLCPLPLSPRRRADGAAALGDLRRRRAVLGAYRARATRRRRHARLAGPDPARSALLDAGARPGPALRVDPARRRARHAATAGPRPRGLARGSRPTGSPRPARRSPWRARRREPLGARCPVGASTLAPDGEILVDGPDRGGRRRPAHRRPRAARRRRPPDVIGRKSDTIVTGGENVAPAEVEAVLLEHPAVADAAVFARPRSRSGARRVTASVVLRAPAEPRGAARVRRRAARALQGPEGGRGGRDAAAHRRLGSCCAGSCR